jgi:hypothetical protein
MQAFIWEQGEREGKFIVSCTLSVRTGAFLYYVIMCGIAYPGLCRPNPIWCRGHALCVMQNVSL